METININGVECVPIEVVNAEISRQLEVDNEYDISMLEEQHKRAHEHLEAKRQERALLKKDKELRKFIDRNYSKQLKDPTAFYNLCKARGAVEEHEVIEVFKMIPKQAKQGLFSKWFK